MVMKETILLVAIGMAIGLGAALATTRLISTLLFRLSPYDPVTISAAALLMAIVAAFAGYLPARRASRVDPMTALRAE
jgi:ABC-type antimicrobial peptide transport system permease subunit